MGSSCINRFFIVTLFGCGQQEFLTSPVFISESDVGLNLLIYVATLGHWQAGPVAVATVGQRSPIAILILSRNGLGDVTNACRSCDRPGPIVRNLK
jgi:hypothetical protein